MKDQHQSLIDIEKKIVTSEATVFNINYKIRYANMCEKAATREFWKTHYKKRGKYWNGRLEKETEQLESFNAGLLELEQSINA